MVSWKTIFGSQRFRFAFRGYEFQWDCNYGIDNKAGWTIAYDGSFVVSQLEPSLTRAVLKALPSIRHIREYKRAANA